MLQLSKQQDHTVVQSKKNHHNGYWNNERLNLKKMAHEKTYLVAIFESLMGTEEKTENYICNAKTLPLWHLILATTVQWAV